MRCLCVYHTPYRTEPRTVPFRQLCRYSPVPTTVARIEKCCISKLLRTDQRSRIHYPHTHRTPLTYQASNRSPPDRLSDDCPILLQHPDQLISNTKVIRNSSTNPDTQPTQVPDVHDTPGLIFPPPDTLS